MLKLFNQLLNIPSLSDPLFDCLFTGEAKNVEESEKQKFKTFQNKTFSCPDLAFVDVSFKGISLTLNFKYLIHKLNTKQSLKGDAYF